jgi:DNA-binding protein H-NS
MPGLNLKSMDVDALLALRADIDRRLHQKRSELEAQLSRLGSESNGSGRRRASPMRGRKVAAKYHSPQGETWAGRGARPRWLVALLKQGHKLEEFAISRAAAARKQVLTKRSLRRKK